MKRRALFGCLPGLAALPLLPPRTRFATCVEDLSHLRGVIVMGIDGPRFEDDVIGAASREDMRRMLSRLASRWIEDGGQIS